MGVKFNIDKIYDLLINEKGFTLDTRTMKIVNKTRGFAVAVHERYETNFPLTVFTQNPQFGKRLLIQILIFYHMWWFREVRRGIKGVVCIGSWYHNTRCYIDFSEIELDRDTAISKGEQRYQKAIYDLHKSEEIWIIRTFKRELIIKFLVDKGVDVESIYDEAVKLLVEKESKNSYGDTFYELLGRKPKPVSPYEGYFSKMFLVALMFLLITNPYLPQL